MANAFILLVLYVYSKNFSRIECYLTPAIACANNVFPHPGGP